MPAAQIALAHISDLHFANGHTGQGPGGHDPLLCSRLPDALNDIARWSGVPREEMRLVVSGDLSQQGAQAEFDTAQQYFANGWPPMVPGLSLPGSDLTDPVNNLMVPGNHDRWGQNPNSTANLPNIIQSRSPCVIQNPATGANSLTVELYGVDSTSGLPSGRANRQLPGRISDPEFRRLEQQLQNSNHSLSLYRARVLVCHHTLYWNGRRIGLDFQSYHRLRTLAFRYNIQVLLTGCLHRTLFHQSRIRRPSLPSPKLLEFGSPTTLLDPPINQVHGLWGHLIHLDDAGRVWWEARDYLWIGDDKNPDYPDGTFVRGPHQVERRLA